MMLLEPSAAFDLCTLGAWGHAHHFSFERKLGNWARQAGVEICLYKHPGMLVLKYMRKGGRFCDSGMLFYVMTEKIAAMTN